MAASGDSRSSRAFLQCTKRDHGSQHATMGALENVHNYGYNCAGAGVPPMSSYSIAEAKNGLPRLIDSAIEGNEVLITRHGRVVAEIRPRAQRIDVPKDRKAATEWLAKRAASRPSVDLDVVALMRAEDEERGW
jgi:antitoxin (DNA-binding transcriptional repressor) of toxin-antitoxin stability system